MDFNAKTLSLYVKKQWLPSLLRFYEHFSKLLFFNVSECFTYLYVCAHVCLMRGMGSPGTRGTGGCEVVTESHQVGARNETLSLAH